MLEPIAARILSGEEVCPGEILAHNARSIIKRDEWRKAHIHEPKGCKTKNCTHGQGDDIDYAIALTQQIPDACTCGRTH